MVVFSKSHLAQMHPDDLQEIKAEISRAVADFLPKLVEEFYGPGMKITIDETLREAQELRKQVEEIKGWLEAMKVARVIEVARMFEQPRN